MVSIFCISNYIIIIRRRRRRCHRRRSSSRSISCISIVLPLLYTSDFLPITAHYKLIVIAWCIQVRFYPDYYVRVGYLGLPDRSH